MEYRRGRITQGYPRWGRLARLARFRARSHSRNDGSLQDRYPTRFRPPAEADPVVPSHAHRPSWRFASQALEAKSYDIHVLWLPRYFQQLQDAHAFPDIGGAVRRVVPVT